MSSVKKRKFLNIFENTLFWLFLLLIRLLPLSWGKFIGKSIGLASFYLLKQRQDLTVSNIKEAKLKGYLKESPDAFQLARQVWSHLGMTASEFLYYYSVNNPSQILKKISIEGEENINNVLAKKKGIILVTAHIGNWELIGIHLSLHGYQLNPLVKTQSNPFFDKIIQKKRSRLGMKVIPRSGFLRPVVQALKRNEIVPFLIDQAATSGNVAVKMFGRSVKLPRGAAEFALKTGTPVVFAYMVREKNNSYRLVISEEVELPRSGSSYEANLQESMQILASLVEGAISEYPEQWLWMHKLWR